MKEQYIVKVKDQEGIVWVYEGHIMGNPIFTFEHTSMPKIMSYESARNIELKYKMTDEQYIIERV